jgi:hypothetical protein
LNYAVVRAGQVVERRTLVRVEEGGSQEVVQAARFHPLPDGRLLVFCHVSGRGRDGNSISENRIMEVVPASELPTTAVDLDPPFTSFFTATVRAGSQPSEVLDLFGTRAGRSGIGYARLRVRTTDGTD